MQTNPKDEQDKVTEILEKLAYALFALRHEEDDKKRLKKQTEEFSFARLEIERLMLTEKELRNLLYFNAQGQFRFDDVAQTLFKAQELKFKNGGM